TVLAARAEALGVHARRGCTVQTLQASDTGVVVHAGGETFHGRWLVGCDGARSAVRKQGGFTFAGTDPEFTGHSLSVELDD
ncbi:MAG: FAD-dependent monooxygenase, partial [Stenotrophomonas sp.]